MNINALLTPSLLTSQTDPGSASSTSGTRTAATATTPALRALQASEQRLQTQMQSASTQISSLGTLQSSLSGIQTAAGALAGLGPTSSDAATGTALAGFVAAFNAGVASAHTAATGDNDQLLQTAAARRAGHQLDRAVAGHRDSAVALKAIGVRQGTDGTLSVDAKAFAAAQAANPALVRSTLASLGTDTGTTVSHALSGSGTVASSLTALSARTKALQGQYGAVLALEQNAASGSTSGTASTGSTGSSLSILGDLSF